MLAMMSARCTILGFELLAKATPRARAHVCSRAARASLSPVPALRLLGAHARAASSGRAAGAAGPAAPAAGGGRGGGGATSPPPLLGGRGGGGGGVGGVGGVAGGGVAGGGGGPFVAEVDERNFEAFVLQSPVPVVLDVYANWCGRHRPSQCGSLVWAAQGRVQCASTYIEMNYIDLI